MHLIRRKIEENPEIEAILKGYLLLSRADTAIFYKFIETNDIESSELIELISTSEIDILNPDLICSTPFEGIGGLEKLINEFKNGSLDFENIEIQKVCDFLKENVRILKFDNSAERSSENSRWNFSYKKRPPKYLVFSNKILNKRYHKSQIPLEGVTSFFCRVEGDKRCLNKDIKEEERYNPWLMTISDIRSNKSHSKFRNESKIFKTQDSHHAAWVLLKNNESLCGKDIDDSAYLGCLRFEYYSTTEQHLGFSSLTIEENLSKEKEYLNSISKDPIPGLIISSIKNINNLQKRESYQKRYNCLDPILRELINIGQKIRSEINKEDPESEKLLEIHNLIEHLYYVLKRNTYYGDAIIERVSSFIEDILETLGLSKEIFADVWDNLRKHEDLMLYNLDKYRDHLMHSFHIFIIGYILIYFIGVKNIKENIDRLYKFISEKEITRKQQKFSRIDVLRIWSLTSLFHDCGYIFEKLSDGLGDFSRRVMGTLLESSYDWPKTILELEDKHQCIEKMSKFYVQCEKRNNGFDEVQLYHHFLKHTINENDHGVLSSIILNQKYNRGGEGKIKVNNIEPIVNFACLAIALHNNPVFKTLKRNSTQPICFFLSPFSFLLAYCDTVQEWGRKKSPMAKEQNAIPHLKDINLKTDDNGKKNIEFLLHYPVSLVGNMPIKNEISGFLNEVINSFATCSDQKFSIRYFIRNDNEFSHDFLTCADKCPLK